MVYYLIFCALILAVAWGSWYWWQGRVRAELAEGAEYEFNRLTNADPVLMENLDRQHFARLFTEVERPRFPLYGLGILTAFLLGSPLMMGLLTAGDFAMNKFGLIPQPVDVADRLLINADGTVRMFKNTPPEALYIYVENLGGFYYFFGMLAFWLLVVWFFMSRYHRNIPGTLREEILRAR